ncbi:uncharacterized protein LOC134258438 [Saccostrea cucullata]|uniref:uncharacterized protein LOC134258438 n=1 Tax=Saccostrea cuccullata TaxID=36930 RepID=UPI002ED03E46
MDTDENSSNSSSCTVLEIDEGEENWSSRARGSWGNSESIKREHFSSDDSNEDQINDGRRRKKKRLKKKCHDGIKSLERNKTAGDQHRKSIQGTPGKTKALSSTKINIGIHGFESEPIFSQVLRSKNGTQFTENDSGQTVLLSDDDNEAGEPSNVRIPSIRFSSSDGEVDTEEENLPSLVKPHCRHKNSDSAVSSHLTMNHRKFSTQDIEDKEFWSDQEMSSSDDDTPILQLKPGKIAASITKNPEPQNTGNQKKNSSSNSTSYSQRQVKEQAVDSVLFEHGNPALKAGMKIKNESQINIKTEESDDETQPFDDDLPDLSPPPVQQSPGSDTEREQSPEIFQEEDPSDKTEEVLYTQMDDCIYIEDSEEEELSQCLFQQEVKLKLDDSDVDSEVEDSNEESWREILCLDDSDDDINQRVDSGNDSEKTLDSAYQVATQLDADLYRNSTQSDRKNAYTSATQSDRKDPYTSATQSDRKDPYMSATQSDRKDPYMSATQSDKKDPYMRATQCDREDPYLGETQTDNHLVCSSDSEDNDIYNSATQVDQNRKNISRNRQTSKPKDFYSNSTQVDSRSSINDEPSEWMEAGHKEMDPYSCATQMDVQTGNRNLNQVVKKKSHFKIQQEDKDPYVCSTQVDNGWDVSSSQDPYSGATQVDILHHSPDSDGTDQQVRQGGDRAPSVDDLADEKISSDPYDIQTQIDTSDHKHISSYSWDSESVSESDDIILLTDLESLDEEEAQTSSKENTPLTKSDLHPSDPYKQSKKVNIRIHETENLDNVYELATQVDDGGDKCVQDHSQSVGEGSTMRGNSDKEDEQRGKARNVFDLYQMETQVTDHSSVKQDEEPKSSESWSDMELYEGDTQVDFLNDIPYKSKASDTLSRVQLANTSSASSTGTLKQQCKSLETSSDDVELAGEDGSNNWVNTPVPLEEQQTKEADGSKELEFLSLQAKLDDVEMFAKKNSRQDPGHSTYNPPMLKRVASSNQRPVIPISPQREKSTKEKREQFKAKSFYSKKQLDLGDSGRRVMGSSSTKTSLTNTAPSGSNVDTDRNEASGWLSKSKGKIDYRKRRRTSSGGAHTKKRKEEVRSTVNMDAIIKAKAEMIARNWIKPYLPEPVKKASIDTSSNFTEDVEMPELEEVRRKGLPLLTTENRHSDSSSANQGESSSSYADRIGDLQTHNENQRQDTLIDNSQKSHSGHNKLSESLTKNTLHMSRLSHGECEQSSSVKDKSRSVLISNKEDLKSSKSKFEKSYLKDKSAKDSSSKSHSRDKVSTSRPSNKDKNKNYTKDKDRSGFQSSKDSSKSKEKSHSNNTERSGESSSKEKELGTSHSKPRDSAGKSSSKNMDSSTRSSSSKSKDDSGKSSSKDRDSSRDKDVSKSKDGSGRSHLKDEKSYKKLNSESSGKSNSKDRDSGCRKNSSKDRDTSRRSSSRERHSSSSSQHASENHISKNSTSLAHSKVSDSLKSSKKDQDDRHSSSISRSKHSSERSHLKDKNGKSEEKDTKRFSSKEHSSSDAKKKDSYGRKTQNHRSLGGNGKENSSSSSSRNPSLLESMDIPKDSSGYNRHEQLKNLNSEFNEENKYLEEKKMSEVFKLRPTTAEYRDDRASRTKVGSDVLTSPSGSPATGMIGGTRAVGMIGSAGCLQQIGGTGCLQQNEEVQEEEEDVKPGKLAMAAAFEKLISSQEMEEDGSSGSNVIIIDDDDLDDVGEEVEMETSKKQNFVKDVSGIKSILNKEFRTFFADKNDERARRGQCVKFRLAPDRAALRTQKYVNSLIQKNKGGIQPGQSSGHQPVHSQHLTPTESRTVEKGPRNFQQSIPRKFQAVSSMDSACGSTQNRQVKVNGRSAGTESDHCSQFFKHLLKWNPSWFAEAAKAREDKARRNCYEPPPVSGEVFQIPEKFDNYKDYVDIFIPHLLQEAWEQSYQSWRTWKNLNPCPQIAAVYSSVEKSDTSSDAFERYTWYSIVTKHVYETMKKNDQLGEKFLVVIKDYGHYLKSKERKMDERFYQPNYWDQIGYIEKIQPHTHPEKVKQTLNTFKVLGTDPSSHQNGVIVLCLTILSRRRPLFKHLLDKLSYIQPLCSLVTTVRQFNAVSSLPRSPLCHHILIPGQKDVFHQNVTVAEPEKKALKQYNDSQRLAICTASKMILENSQAPKICLLQGPPGTGKSFTVVGIVEKILQLCGSHLRICLCAPSNNAVDLLIKRLDDHKREKRNTDFASALSMVRIGNTESIHRDVRKFSLSYLVQQEATKLRREKKLENIPSSVRANYDQMKQKMEILRSKRSKSKGEEAERLTADLRQLEKRVKEMEKDHLQKVQDIPLTRTEEFRLKQKILQEATIVCGTLSAFGQHFIFDLLSHRKREGKPMFDCVIVDEASQANELDCIIPLQYEVNKFILVGDPEQLPPTVTSSKAARNYFGQSLFERFYRHFQSCKESPSPILMLDTQYRMHPDIAYWPSQYIYQGKLKTDKSLKQRSKENSRLKPFVLFNVEDSLEYLSQTTGSVNNPTEVEFIVQLSLVILKSTRPHNIGIIAPYKSQKNLLLSSLSQKGVKGIEISTVDGFQGREKEVIIFSCVRAKSQSGSIGFMADRKRMNVALTRAKSALYIVAHLDSLQTDADWKNLIRDAGRRSLIYSVASGQDFNEAAKNILIQK